MTLRLLAAQRKKPDLSIAYQLRSKYVHLVDLFVRWGDRSVPAKGY
jgi:hypothetical protein